MLDISRGTDTLAFSNMSAFSRTGASLTLPIDMVMTLTKNMSGFDGWSLSSAFTRSVRMKEISSCIGCRCKSSKYTSCRFSSYFGSGISRSSSQSLPSCSIDQEAPGTLAKSSMAKIKSSSSSRVICCKSKVAYLMYKTPYESSLTLVTIAWKMGWASISFPVFGTTLG